MTKLSNHHTACLGCAQIVAARLVVDQLGNNTIVVNATGCLEVTTTTYPQSAWQVPWIHSLFANAAPVGSGIAAALEYLTMSNKKKNIPKPTILVQGVPVQVHICTDCLRTVKQGKIFGLSYPQYVSAEAAKAEAKA